jgi:phosphoribosylamine---glycine ligase
MNLLLLGGGGREHAIAWKISKSPLIENLFIAPGNAGTSIQGSNIPIDPLNFKEIEKFVVDNKVELIVVGPEDPIVNGIYDYFQSKPQLSKIKILAPSANAALLEGSKDYAKAFMAKYKIPTANYKTFTKEQFDDAKNYIINHQLPVVLKADGLAAGKGVTVCFELKQAIDALEEAFLQNRFGNAGNKLVVEEFLSGIELSVFILTDGKNYLILPEAKDYKRIGEGDTGPNTGGMGSISPVPFADEVFMEKVKQNIIEPTLRGIQEEKLDYRGFVFFGLMNSGGNPFVIEYNVRLGDPETEAILPRIDEDLLPYLWQAASGELSQKNLRVLPHYSATVMLVSGGYPGVFEKGKIIHGLDLVSESNLFHAGTKFHDNNTVTSGGRVIAVNSLEATLDEALEKSYSSIQKISFEKMYFRRDLGKDLMI